MKVIIILAVITGIGLDSALAGNHSNATKKLPKGLQMKLDRGGSLPPGWEMKLVRGEILDDAIYEQSHELLPVDSEGIHTVRVDDKVVKFFETSREIVEVLDLLNR